MKKNILILHILSSKIYSGAENVVCQIIHMFKDDTDFKFIYCSPDGEIRKALLERNITFKPIKEMSVSEIKRVIKMTNPQIIHAHDMRASLFASLACGKIPLICHIHNNNFNSRKLTLKAFLFRYAGKKSKHIFWVSNSAYNGYYFHDELEYKSSILYNVIDSKQLMKKANRAENKTRYDVVFLGRLNFEKNPQRVISVLEKVAEKYPKIKAAIIGTGDLENDIKELISLKKLDNNIDMLGFLSNPYGILKNSKVMIMTSRWEGTPMCGLEATALGVPIISTPTDGLKDIIEVGKTGYLSDNDDDLANGILELVTNEDRFLYMKNNCYKRNEKINNLSAYKESVMKQYRMWY